ncbi:MAG: hypothetical protein WDN28_09045 [Chthoniobacter sp.]
MPRPSIPVGSCRLGGPEPLYILGPCVIESEEFVWRMARQLKAIAAEVGVPFVFKASYDKANRTSVKSFRGLDVRGGCQILAEIGRELGVPVTTDIHSPEEAKIAGEYIDVLQIPALSLPADRPDSGGRGDEAGGEREEGPVPRSLGCEEHRRQIDRLRQRPILFYGTRHHFRL